MSSLNNILFKYFLKYDIWKEAKKLLDFQIDSTFKSYNNLNFFYFRKIKGTEKLETKGYFEQRIENNAFYGLVDEFFFHKYNTPKQGMGLRLYSFFSYPMLLLYYSIGIYLLKLTSQFILDNKKNFNLSRYGGNLKIDTSGNLIVNESSTLYRDHYFAFKKDIRLQILERDNKAVIKLDIQNYFDCISMSNLLDLIDKSVKPSEKTILNYDEHTIKTLKFYFNFLNSNTLPQGNNNLISGYIGFLYLFFGDLEIESILKDLNLEYESILEEFKIVRYVDDIYLFLKFKGLKIIDKGVNRDSDNLIVQMNKLGRTLDEILYDYKSRENAKKFISDFLFKLSDTFYKKLNLKFNSKSEIFWLDSDKDKNKLLKVINKVSEDYIEIEDDNKVKPQEKILRICKSLRNIKSKSIIEIFTSDYKNIQHILRYSFDKNVNQLLDNKRNELKKIEDEFQNFDFNYVRFYPQTIILLINKIDDVKKLFRKFLLSKKNLTTFDIDLVIHFLCQTGFKDNKLIDILANSEISEIINRYKKSLNVVDNTKTGYYNISFSKLLPLINKEISLIEQIKFRVFAEKRNEFSVALNHLLNEVQLICYLVENPAIEIKKYDISNVKSYLESKEIETNLCNNISNLFDRRNNNPVSHPGNDTRFAKTVLKDEYFEYKTEVGKVLKKIF